MEGWVSTLWLDGLAGNIAVVRIHTQWNQGLFFKASGKFLHSAFLTELAGENIDVSGLVSAPSHVLPGQCLLLCR